MGQQIRSLARAVRDEQRRTSGVLGDLVHQLRPVSPAPRQEPEPEVEPFTRAPYRAPATPPGWQVEEHHDIGLLQSLPDDVVGAEVAGEDPPGRGAESLLHPYPLLWGHRLQVRRPIDRVQVGPWDPGVGAERASEGRLPGSPRPEHDDATHTHHYAFPGGGSGRTGLLVQQPEQIVAVAALLQRFGHGLELGVVDVAAAPGDLLDAADLPALPLLDDPDELA